MIVKSLLDIALDIVREHEELSSSGIVLAALARKTDAFAEIKSNIIMRTIKWGKHLYSLMLIIHLPSLIIIIHQFLLIKYLAYILILPSFLLVALNIYSHMSEEASS